jgi:hypothetical protein
MPLCRFFISSYFDMNVLKLVLYFSEGFKTSSCRKRCRAWYIKITILSQVQCKYHADQLKAILTLLNPVKVKVVK